MQYEYIPHLTSTSGFTNSPSLAGNTCTAHAAPPLPKSEIRNFDNYLLLQFGLGEGRVELIPSSIHNILRVRQVTFPRGEHLHRARLELGNLRLGVERVVRQ